MKKCTSTADEFLFHKLYINNLKMEKCNFFSSNLKKMFQVQVMSYYYINVETMEKCKKRINSKNEFPANKFLLHIVEAIEKLKKKV